MSMSGTSLGEPHPAFDAQPRAILLTPWRKREREHQGIPEGRLEIEQAPVQRVPVLGAVSGFLLITEQFPTCDPDAGCHGFEAPGALPRHRRDGGDRDKHPLGHRLEPDVKFDVRALGDVCHAGGQIRRGWHRPGFRMLRPRAPGKGPGIEHQRPVRAGAGDGCLAERGHSEER